MSNYQSPDDIKYVASLLNLAPQEARAFIEFDHQTVKREDGLIHIKTREFIA